MTPLELALALLAGYAIRWLTERPATPVVRIVVPAGMRCGVEPLDGTRIAVDRELAPHERN